MKIALLVDEVPFPPRNGVTIPTHQLCEAFGARNITYELFIASEASDAGKTQQMLEQASAAYGVPVRLISRRRCSALAGAADELLRGRPRFANWIYTSVLPDLSGFDTLVASPISVLDLLLKLRRPHHRTAALINDVYYSVLATDNYYAGTFKSVFAQFLARARASRMRHIEANMLSQIDRIMVQTRRDLAWLRLVGGRKLMEHGRAHHNAAHPSLFEIPANLQDKQPAVIFSADLKSLLYQRNLDRLLDIWPNVIAAVPQAELRISGTFDILPIWLQQKIRQTPRVVVLGFVEHIADVYRDARLSFAPVYKRYGFINKVAEPVAAGVPVIADGSAFNGMEALLLNGACFRIDNTADITPLATALLTDNARWTAASTSCKAFATQELASQQRYDSLLKAILD